MGTSERRSEILGKFLNVVQEKDGEDWLDRSSENKEVLCRDKEERNILPTVKRRKVNWIGYVLHRNCLLKNIIRGKAEKGREVTGR